MKGIILAGGHGTRLHPVTKGVCKQLLPVYDKPMFYYPLSVLMNAGIRDILFITNEEDVEIYKKYFGDGSIIGLNLEYIIQPSPDGLAQAFMLGDEFVGEDTCALVLGDNIFIGGGLNEKLISARTNAENGYATIFGYRVSDPERFGIMELDKDNNVISVEEKPEHPKSKYAITGLYFYDNRVVSKAFKVQKSARGEYEITDLNRMYLDEGKLKAEIFDDQFGWYDAGLHDSLLDTSNCVRTMEERIDKGICYPEIIAYENGWITLEQYEKIAMVEKGTYGDYLKKELKNK